MEVDVVHLFDNANAGFTCPVDGFLLYPLTFKESDQEEKMRARYKVWFLGIPDVQLAWILNNLRYFDS